MIPTQNRHSILLMIGLVGFVLLLGNDASQEAYALETNNNYFVESKETFMMIEIDSSGKTTLQQGGMVINNQWEYWDAESLKKSQTQKNGDIGRFFGKTSNGNLFYGMYDIVGNIAQIKIKIMHDGIKSVIIENASITEIFEGP
jgi:hypothetical protein